MTYQIEAIIEKFSQNGIQLKGAGKYLFEKSNEKDKDKECWNILEADDSKEEIKPEEKLKFVDSKKEFPVAISTNELGMQHLLGYAFAEKKKLKFDLEEKDGNYAITAVSHAST